MDWLKTNRYLIKLNLTLLVFVVILAGAMLAFDARGATPTKRKLLVETPKCGELAVKAGEELHAHGWKRIELKSFPGTMQAIWAHGESRRSIIISFERIYAPYGWTVVGSRDCMLGDVTNIFTLMER